MLSIRAIWVCTALVLVVLVLFIAMLFITDMSAAHDRVSTGSQVAITPTGQIEYAEGGTGLPVLVVHGSGGGFDQGALIANALLDDNHHWIAPSRFGYLRSDLPDNANWEQQAHGYAYLLDSLGIPVVSIVALSHGGPSALAFSALYPERVASLILISCGVSPSDAQEQAQANTQGNLLTWIYQHDFAYWAITRVFKNFFLELMGGTTVVISALDPDQLQVVEHIIDFMNPVSLRSSGVIFDNSTPLTGYDTGAITAPTLIFHATDDTLQLFHNAEYAAASIPDSRLYKFDQGGHLLLAVELAFIKETMGSFIGENSVKAPALPILKSQQESETLSP